MTTFTRTSPGTYTHATDSFSGAATTTITGSAIRVKGDPLEYDEPALVLGSMPTLLFTPTDYNLAADSSSFVQPGDTVVFGGTTYTVKKVYPIAPDGYVIAARIIVAS